MRIAWKTLLCGVFLAGVPSLLNAGQATFSPVAHTIETAAAVKNYIVIKALIPREHHIYGNPKGPGVGKPTILNARPVRYFSFERTRYLKAEKFYSPGDSNYCWGYSGETFFFIPFRVDPACPTGTYQVTVDVDALLCSNTTCYPTNASLPVTVKVTSERKAFSYDERINVLIKDSFLPDDAVGIDGSPEKKDGNDATSGLSVLDLKPEYESHKIAGIIQALLFSIIAGFILNFMPCVLPVVSLKVMGFVSQAKAGGASLKVQGALYSGGILFTFFVLAVLAAFFGYGWGGLFQKQAFLVAMIVFVFIFALALFEVFVITPPRFLSSISGEGGNVYIDAFLKGILTTFLATPCSGPFLGGTLAWALTQPPLTIFFIFFGVGIGMASPYLLLIARPNLLRFLPRPGDWMVTLERVMGFVLVFTAIYLMTILREDLVFPVLTFCAFVAGGVWIIGRYGTIVQSGKTRMIAWTLSALILAGGFLLSFRYLYTADAPARVKHADFSVDRILAAKEENKVSMVKFTADWCPNCKVVERLSLNTKNVARFVEKHNIQFLSADITIENPEAQLLMKKLGSSSIPLLAVFPGGDNFLSPLCLRDMYSEQDVLRALDKAVRKSKDNRFVPGKSGQPRKPEGLKNMLE